MLKKLRPRRLAKDAGLQKTPDAVGEFVMRRCSAITKLLG